MNCGYCGCDIINEDSSSSDKLCIKCYLESESYESKSLKWYISLDFIQQVELSKRLINGPTYNLTISDIMDAYEDYEENQSKK